VICFWGCDVSLKQKPGRERRKVYVEVLINSWGKHAMKKIPVIILELSIDFKINSFLHFISFLFLAFL
jgi:hypothetical protein